MMAFAREMIRPRQLKLTRIQEIILSNSKKTSEKYIKLLFKNGGKGAKVESLKLVFDDTQLFSKWTLALSALVYIWKWLEMPDRRAHSKTSKESQTAKERKHIDELGPTGKHLVSEILCR